MLSEMIATAMPPTDFAEISFEEFLAQLDRAEPELRAEWVDRRLEVMSPVSRVHQQLSGWLYILLHTFSRRRQLGEVLQAPFLMRLHQSDQAREPDLAFVRAANQDRIHSTYLDGPADLVVEIISPESVHRDRGRKFMEYEAEGIGEYWLIDPIRRQAEFYRLGEDGYYHQVLPDEDGRFHSASVEGFWLQTDWLWQSPLPDELDVLHQLQIV